MMDKDGLDIEHSLIYGTDTVKRGYSALVKNCGKLIAGLTAVIVVLVTFTEIGFYDIGAKELTANLLFILVASYVIYFTLEDAGEALGRESEEYRLSLAKYRETKGKIDADSVVELRDFCARYAKEELEYIERICENVGNINLNTGGDMLSQLAEILGGRK